MSVQSAAVLPAPRAPLAVIGTTVPEPAADEILVRVRTVAINPVDWVIQGTSRVTYRWLRTPAVLGSDVAGEVVAVGSAVTRFRVGQRVFGLATGTDKGRDPLREGAFQEYTVLLERLAAPIPDALSDEEAAVPRSASPPRRVRSSSPRTSDSGCQPAKHPASAAVSWWCGAERRASA